MCGLAGIVQFDKPPHAPFVTDMLHSLAHRGPDGAGLWSEGPACLGHRRLSILDLSVTANQPMIDDTGRYVIIFNGEIYNFRVLRRQLEDRGESFRTTGDTEVLLKLYSSYGRDMLKHINGMFSFLIWDRERREYFAARDRMGEKPFYYMPLPDGGIVFASELKAMQTCTQIEQRVDPVSLGRYLTLGYSLDERTILASVKRLKPATYLYGGGGRQLSLCEYWSLASAFNSPYQRSPTQAQEEITELLRDSVRLRLESDVPIGVFLSGGIDSAGITAAMKHSIPSKAIQAYTMGFREDSYSEVEEARASASSLGVSFHSREVQPALLSELPKILYHGD
jgi:asparagine synthase (glutamine-hydrolysing)